MHSHTDNDVAPRSGQNRALHRLKIASAVVLAAIAIAVVILAFRWPFKQKDVIQALEQRVKAPVAVTKFKGVYFPHPGCVLQGLTVRRSSQNSDNPPFATASKLTIKASYLDLFLRPGYIRLILIDNLAVHIAPRGQRSMNTWQTQAQGGPEMRVGSIVVQNASLRIARKNGRKSLDFAIHSLVLHSVARNQELTYSVEMTNPLPPGELSVHGKFGPWNAQNFRETPLSGSSVLERANLDAFPSISGSLSSQNEFGGVLEKIAISGWTDIPDFHVKTASHTVHVHAPFRAIVNGTNGDVQLDQVKAKIENTTTIDAKASIAGHTGRPGKVTSVDFSVENGRIEDVLDLFISSPEPPLQGVATLRAHAILEAFGGSFLEKTLLDGTFEINDARFSRQHTQLSVDSLSARSLGKKQSDPSQSGDVRCDFQGRLELENGKAQFTGLSMSMPGASAKMNGVYNLLNDHIDFHGTLKTDAEISKTTHGIKSILLKPLDPIFKRKNAGAVIPVEMVGTYEQPHFGIDLAARHDHPSGTH